MKWRMSTRQTDAVISDEHVGECMGMADHELTREQRAEVVLEDEVNYYGGHFVCESVNPRFRPLIVAAPVMLDVLKRIVELAEGYPLLRAELDIPLASAAIALAEPEPQPPAPEPIDGPAHEPGAEREP